ncbi:hypothetical protein [Cellulophaga sp. L1A9]|uniref:hypothetical protein n=1 Tax=Cellulophaga sp. L1A9 TaxID=2686362 RepID=UPI00131D0120|nr:hypothetical protein [Cellulophaga sp. L1A9]
MKIKFNLIMLFLVALTSCSMKPTDKKQELDTKPFEELHNHKGSKNYEVSVIIPKQKEAQSFDLDTISEKLYINSFFKSKLKKSNVSEYNMIKLDFLGSKMDSTGAHAKLKDGTLWNSNFYISWLTNGDTTRHKYIDPFTNKKIDDIYEFEVKEKDPKKWLKKFEEFYTKAKYVHIRMSDYYFKVNDKWYFMEGYKMGEANNLDLEKKYPKKEDQDVRMVELKNIGPKWYHKGFEDRDTSLIKMIDYQSDFYVEENQGPINVGYSAGWWYLEVYMPLGDTIKVKRYSYFEDPQLELYKVPSTYGGREHVLFIVQKPRDSHIAQVSGMYAIRPRDPKQPQRRYKNTVYKKNEEGLDVIDKSKSIETDEYKTWVKQKG